MIKIIRAFILLIILVFIVSSSAFAGPVKYNKNSDKISIEFRNVDLSHALRMFSKETGKNIIAGSDIYGKITVSLTDVTPDEALKHILDASGYKYIIKDDIVRILPSGKKPDFVHLPSGLVVKSFELDYSSPDEVEKTLNRLVPIETKVVITKGSNIILVEGPISIIKRVEALIKNIDIPPKQIMVEAKIIELENSTSGKFGTNIKNTNPNNPDEIFQTVGLADAPTSTNALGMYYSVTNQNVEALAEALQTRTGYNLLSSPKVVALNGEEAEIITGSRLGYKTKTVTSTGLIESIEFLDVGTKLTIKPDIKSDGNILMEIHPEISSGSVVNDLPQKDSTETTTKLIVKDGQTIIIGGLIKEETNKTVRGIPILADIPIIGIPFRKTELDTKRNEIIILISPHIVDSEMIAEMQKPIAEREEEFYRRKSSTPLDLFK